MLGQACVRYPLAWRSQVQAQYRPTPKTGLDSAIFEVKTCFFGHKQSYLSRGPIRVFISCKSKELHAFSFLTQVSGASLHHLKSGRASSQKSFDSGPPRHPHWGSTVHVSRLRQDPPQRLLLAPAPDGRPRHQADVRRLRQGLLVKDWIAASPARLPRNPFLIH